MRIKSKNVLPYFINPSLLDDLDQRSVPLDQLGDGVDVEPMVSSRFPRFRWVRQAYDDVESATWKPFFHRIRRSVLRAHHEVRTIQSATAKDRHLSRPQLT